MTDNTPTCMYPGADQTCDRPATVTASSGQYCREHAKQIAAVLDQAADELGNRDPVSSRRLRGLGDELDRAETPEPPC